jgi:hypothetical protein
MDSPTNTEPFDLVQRYFTVSSNSGHLSSPSADEPIFSLALPVYSSPIKKLAAPR